jgi:hypothetical protein
MRSVLVHVFPYECISRNAHPVFVDAYLGNLHAPTGLTSAAMIPLIAGDNVVGQIAGFLIGKAVRMQFLP